MQPIIKVENLSKQYLIGAQSENFPTLRDAFTGMASASRRFFRGDGRASKGLPFWALRDVNFEVMPGEVIGFIGRNGAGKSTLLKILSRITEPTTGRVELHGRIASLLEVGTGFHPELSGRENIFLNGAILGMKKTEIKDKFDEIVAFAELEKFIDTPVKRYSSGMYVRLAFAVAAHLEPEILIVDEVLAVGDAVFQKKCLGKMSEAAEGGRTVLFVSHNMGALAQLCSRGLILAGGKCVFDGGAKDAVAKYMGSIIGGADHTVAFDPDSQKDMQILSMSVVSPGDDRALSSCPYTEPISLLIKYRVKKWTPGTYLCVDVHNDADMCVLWSADVKNVDEMMIEREPGVFEARVTVPPVTLSPGIHYFTAAFVAPHAPHKASALDVREKAVSVEVLDNGSLLANFGVKIPSVTTIPLQWETEGTTDEG